jgi:hypothetical protein
MAKKEKRVSPYKAGHYYAAKYNLAKGKTNGDLIVGVVKSVRANGDVILTNLLNGRRSVKDEEKSMKRNKRVRKDQADKIVEIFKREGYDAARKAAVNTEPFNSGHERAEQILHDLGVLPARIAAVAALRHDLNALACGFVENMFGLLVGHGLLEQEATFDVADQGDDQ